MVYLFSCMDSLQHAAHQIRVWTGVFCSLTAWMEESKCASQTFLQGCASSSGRIKVYKEKQEYIDALDTSIILPAWKIIKS